MDNFSEILQKLLSFPPEDREMILSRDLPGFNLEFASIAGDINLVNPQGEVVATAHNL